MKLAYKTNDVNSAYELKALLENNGIPSSVSDNSGTNRGSHIPNGVELWIYINSQYDDAMRLIDDHDHEVNHKVDVDEFYKIINDQEMANRRSNLYSRFIKYGVIFIVIVFAVVTLIVKFRAA